MNLASFLFLASSAAALAGAPRSASALPVNDPRIAINAVNTPGIPQGVFLITSPGSYYLEADLIGEPAKAGILVAATDVRIDLMGFSLRGDAASTHAIAEVGYRSNVVIWNGSISGWSGAGVHFVLSSNVQVRDLGLRSMGDGGIVLGADGVVERCNLFEMAGFGIRTTSGAYVSQTMVNAVGTRGIEVLGHSMVRDCKVRGSGTEGVRVGVGSSVLGCTINGGTVGIYSYAGTVAECLVRETSSAGVHLIEGALRNSHIVANYGHGIDIPGPGSLVVGNRVAFNGGDGIRALGSARIEENDVRSHSQGVGIRTFGTGSFVAKNTLFANATHLSVPNAGNFVGPLVSVNAVNGRNEPWANVYGN